MGLLPKPSNVVDNVDSWDATKINQLYADLYNTIGATVASGGTGEGLLDNTNIKTGANILPSKVADTGVVCGNTTNPGTQTITRPTVFQGEGTAANTMGSANTPTTYDGGTFYSETGTTNSNGASSTLKTKDIPANTLTTTGRGIRIRAWGTTTNSANGKTINLQVGATTVVSKSLALSVLGAWEIEAVILRTGANTQECIGRAFNSHGTAVSGTDGPTIALQLIHTALALTETAAITVKCVAGSATGTELQQTGLVIEFI